MSSSLELTIIDVDPSQIYTQYDVPQVINADITNITGGTTVTTINGGGGGSATGPNVTIGSTWNGVNFVASGNSLNLDITNAASARSDLGAAASGVNTDITQLNGASQVDVSGSYKVSGTQVVAAQQAAIPDATGGATIDSEARAALNALLAELRTHGLIAP